MNEDLNSTQHMLAKIINSFSEWLEQYLGSLTGEILGGVVVALLILLIFEALPWFVKWCKKYPKPKIYVLMPTETERNREHLAHQINGFRIFLSQDTNKKLKPKFVMVKDSDEIEAFLEKIKKQNAILITTISFVFDNTLRLINKPNKYQNIKVVGTLGSESKEFENINQPTRVIRVFPPDYDEAKVAYEFFYHQILSYFCTNDHSTCCYSHKKVKSGECAAIILYHSESYGVAISKSFNTYYNKNKTDNIINPFGEQDANDFMNLETVNFPNDSLSLNKKVCFHLIFFVGYEPNISDMLENVFNEIKKEEINMDNVCFLFPPTVAVKEWKKKICDTINQSSLTINKNKLFYLKSKIPVDNKIEIKSLKKLDSLNFYNYEIKEKSLEKELKNEIEKLDLKEKNYISTFAYLALKVTKKIYKGWNTNLNLHEIKHDTFKNFIERNTDPDIEKQPIYSNGDSINHFTIRQFDCENVDKKNLKKEKNNEN